MLLVLKCHTMSLERRRALSDCSFLTLRPIASLTTKPSSLSLPRANVDSASVCGARSPPSRLCACEHSREPTNTWHCRTDDFDVSTPNDRHEAEQFSTEFSSVRIPFDCSARRRWLKLVSSEFNEANSLAFRVNIGIGRQRMRNVPRPRLYAMCVSRLFLAASQLSLRRDGKRRT